MRLVGIGLTYVRYRVIRKFCVDPDHTNTQPHAKTVEFCNTKRSIAGPKTLRDVNLKNDVKSRLQAFMKSNEHFKFSEDRNLMLVPGYGKQQKFNTCTRIRKTGKIVIDRKGNDFSNKKIRLPLSSF